MEGFYINLKVPKNYTTRLDIEKSKRSRELGLLRLGQPLKSFRDHLKAGQFGIYQPIYPPC
jgi:hypothetical protein